MTELVHFVDTEPVTCDETLAQRTEDQHGVSPDHRRGDFCAASGFHGLEHHVRGGRNGPSDIASEAVLAEAVQSRDAYPWAEAHLDAWREAYRAFGAKPKKTHCSAEALRKRAVKDGAMRPLNAVVDLYNAVSLHFAVPVGGEDATSYAGLPRLCLADGDEPFHTMAEGQQVVDTPEAGEVIWRDDVGVTCRRWNWRQGPRTQITEASQDMWFVLERLDPMPVEALLDAGRMLVGGLRRISPKLALSVCMFDAENLRGKALSVL